MNFLLSLNYHYFPDKNVPILAKNSDSDRSDSSEGSFPM